MKCLFVFPPGWNPHAPYLALPLLAGRLRAEGHAVDVLDANIDLLDSVLRAGFLAEAAERLRDVRGARNDGDGDPRPQLAALMAADLIRNVDAAADGFRSMEWFADAERYEWCRRVISAALNLVSCAYPGLRLTLHGIRFTRYRSVSCAEVLAAVEDRDANIIRDYFERRLRRKIESGDYQMLGLSVTDSDQLIPAMTIASLAKELRPELPVVFGGNHFSRIAAGWRVRHPFHDIIDYGVLGEGENAVSELAEAIDGARSIESVSNLCFIRDDRVIHTETSVVDLDRLPFPDFAGLPLDRYFSPAPILPTYATRSCCWNRCAFCTIPSRSGHFRMRRADRIAQEIEHHVATTGTPYFTFIDESLPPGVVERFSEAILDRRVDVRWYGEARLVAGFNDAVLATARAAGARLIQFGLESFNERVLDLIDKGIRLSDVEPLLERCLRNGIAFHLFCMIGFPTETAEEALRTLSFAKRIIDRAVSEYGNTCCTKGISTFGLERVSRVAQTPERFGVRVIDGAPDEDLRLDWSYVVDQGLSANQAAAFVEAFAGLDLYQEVTDRFGPCPNRTIAPSPAREEETFLRWCRRDAPASSAIVARRDTARWPAAWDEPPAHYAVAPWSRIATEPANGAERFAVNARGCRVHHLSRDDIELLARLPLTAPRNDDRLRLRRLANLGIIVAPKENPPEHSFFVEAFPDVDLLCFPDERYVLYDRAREEVATLNHTGAVVWQMLENGIAAGELLTRVRRIYGPGFTDDHLREFVATLAADGLVHVC